MIFKVRDIILDKEKMRVFKGLEEIILTPNEFALLEYLMINKNHILSHDQIINRAWGNESSTDNVRVYISYLKKKGIEIENRRGWGYLIRDD